MKKYLLLLISIFCLSFVSASNWCLSNQWFGDNSRTTNYSIFLNQSVCFDEWNVTTLGRIQIWNISSNQTATPTIFNINNSNSVVDLYGTSNMLINGLFYNGSFSHCGSTSDINSNDNQVNITILANDNCTFLNDFNITENINRNNSPFSLSKNVVTNLITYTITSNLTTQVSNISFFVPSTTPCPNTVTVLSNSTTSESSLSFSCNSSSFLNNITLNYLNNSINLIYLRYDFGPGGGGGSGTPFVESNESETEEVTNVTKSCKVSSDKIFLPLPTIKSFNLDSCTRAEKFNKFFRLSYKDGEYKIIGIKLWIVISLIILIIGIKFITKKR